MIRITAGTSLSLLVLLTRNSSALGGGATEGATAFSSSHGWCPRSFPASHNSYLQIFCNPNLIPGTMSFNVLILYVVLHLSSWNLLTKQSMLMLTVSGRQEQRLALLPNSTHRGVAKLVDSAQLKPVLKPEW